MWLAVSTCLALFAAAEEPLVITPYFQEYRVGGYVLEGGFEPDDQKITLNEPLYITFRLANTGRQTFRFELGADYQNSLRRPNRFKITARDWQGNPVRDPALINVVGSGFQSTVFLEPGEVYIERLLINQWCDFKQTGPYRIHCKRKFYLSRGPEESFDVITDFILSVSPADSKAIGKAIDYWGHFARTARDEDTLEQAVKALAFIEDERVIPHLAAGLKYGDRNKSLAVEALSRYGSSAAADGLIIALTDTYSEYLRDEAGAALRKMGRTDQAISRFRDQLKSHQSESRCRAAMALGSLGLQDAVPNLLELLKSDDLQAHLAAIEALRKLGQPVRPEWIATILKRASPTGEEFQMAKGYLGIIPKEQAARVIVGSLDIDDPSLKNNRNRYLLESLKAVGIPDPNLFAHYYSDLNHEGTFAQIRSNRSILATLERWYESQK